MNATKCFELCTARFDTLDALTVIRECYARLETCYDVRALCDSTLVPFSS